VPMRRIQALLVMLALLGAAGAIFPWADRNRLTSAAIAFAVIFTVAVLRVRGHQKQLSRSANGEDTMTRVQAIREARSKRFTR
jgi:hypothetical protein